MGTRSTIAMVLDSGKIRGVYCHWDGYLSHNGKVLFEHYQDPQKIQELLDGGDISSLGPEIGEKHDFDNRPENYTTFYTRDRGEPDCLAKTFDTVEDWLNYLGQEFQYLFRNGRWEVQVGSGNGNFGDLETLLVSESATKAQEEGSGSR